MDWQSKKHFYAPTPVEAEEKKWRAIIKYKDTHEACNSEDLFGEVKSKWIRNKVIKTRATQKMYEKDIFPKLKALDSRSISSIDENDIKDILDPLSDKTNIAEKVYMCLGQIFKYAVAKRIIRYNPIDLIDRPKNKTSTKAKRGLTASEKKVIEMTEWNHRQELLLKLLLDYGLRKQEATALQKKNIDLKNRTISIDHANDYTTNVPQTKKPKSDAGNRVVPMLDSDEEYFRALTKEMKEDDYLLQMTNGKVLTENSYRQLWDSVRRRMKNTARAMNLEIPGDLTPRMCRHEYSIKIMNMSQREQMYLMGHEDISTTQKNYQTISVEHINRKELNKICKKKTDPPSSAKK